MLGGGERGELGFGDLSAGDQLTGVVGIGEGTRNLAVSRMVEVLSEHFVASESAQSGNHGVGGGRTLSATFLVWK